MRSLKRWRLARWLGPWARPTATPKHVVRTTHEIALSAGQVMTTWRYVSSRHPPRRALLLLQGLHFAGPEDPRMDRFARILADAGALVIAPFLPTYTGLRLGSGVIDEATAALRALQIEAREARLGRPVIFSISFGSLPALRLAATRPDDVGGLVVFGGYADWKLTLRFALTGEHAGDPVTRDPLNQPVIWMNLLEHMDEALQAHDRERVCAAWLAYMRRTWGRPEMKPEDAHHPVAREVAQELPAHLRRLFLMGCGCEASEEGLARCMAALERRSGLDELLDPRPQIPQIRTPTVLIHGRGDDVIPYTQLDALRQAFSPEADVRAFLTGLYGHTGLARFSGLFGELGGMVGILRALSTVGKADP